MADELDPDFAALPQSLRDRIDRAFDSATPHANGRPHKRRKLAHSAPPADAGRFVTDDTPAGGFVVDASVQGGFIVDDSSGGFLSETLESAGGFLPEEAEESDEEPPSHIPLSLVPDALQLLDLQPDDEDVLSVFRNAASGWGETRRSHAPRPELEGGADNELYVDRRDWRAVCAALLGVGIASDTDGDVDMEAALRDGVHDKDGQDDSDSGSGEDYVEPLSDLTSDSEGELDEDASDDDYHEDGFVSTKATNGKGKQKAEATSRTRASVKRRLAASPLANDVGDTRTRPITARQKDVCRAAFALFFPDTPDAALDKQRIKIKDITRVAKLLKEKITAEEVSPHIDLGSSIQNGRAITCGGAGQIVDMLEAFSSTPDKSMGLLDFERMMITAKLA